MEYLKQLWSNSIAVRFLIATLGAAIILALVSGRQPSVDLPRPTPAATALEKIKAHIPGSRRNLPGKAMDVADKAVGTTGKIVDMADEIVSKTSEKVGDLLHGGNRSPEGKRSGRKPSPRSPGIPDNR